MKQFREYTPAELAMRSLMIELGDAVERVKLEKMSKGEDLTVGNAFLDLERGIYVGIQYILTEQQIKMMKIKE